MKKKIKIEINETELANLHLKFNQNILKNIITSYNHDQYFLIFYI